MKKYKCLYCEKLTSSLHGPCDNCGIDMVISEEDYEYEYGEVPDDYAEGVEVDEEK